MDVNILGESLCIVTLVPNTCKIVLFALIVLLMSIFYNNTEIQYLFKTILYEHLFAITISMMAFAKNKNSYINTIPYTLYIMYILSSYVKDKLIVVGRMKI